MDWEYHKRPTEERRKLQDEIVIKALKVRENDAGLPEDRKVALFTAGGYGAGKGHVVREFLCSKIISLLPSFVW